MLQKDSMFKFHKIENWKYFNNTTSTNTALSNYVNNNYANTNILLYTFRQTAGRGQVNNKWFSDERKNLSLSFYLPIFNLLAKNQFYINCFISLTLCNWLEKYLPNEKVSIKWPNDIYVNNKKIAGILIQNNILGQNINYSIIGMGININQKTFPSSLPNPCALAQFSDHNFDLNQLVIAITKYFETQLQNSQFIPKQKLKTEYENRLFRKGELSVFKNNDLDTLFNGTIIGVTDAGALKIQSDSNILNFDLKELSYVI